MKLYELFIKKRNVQLNEVNMSSSALKSWAKKHASGMKAGFEAELIFKNMLKSTVDDEEEDQEPDYDRDERANTIDQILEFFSPLLDLSTRNSAEQQMHDSYTEWRDTAVLEEFAEQARDLIRDYIKADLRWEYSEKIYEYLVNELGKTPEEATDMMNDPDRTDNDEYIFVKTEVSDQLTQLVERSIRDHDGNWQGAYDEFIENWEASERSWLRDIGIYNMTDVGSRFSFANEWPYWSRVDNTVPADGHYHVGHALILAGSLEKTLGVKTQVESSTRGAGAKRNTPSDVWVFEADGSLNPTNREDMPIEIVSPPMSLEETLAIMPKFFEWAKSHKAYANKSTGIHMSVSMPEHSGNDLDYVKAALFLGDQYILEQFGRTANSYAQSAMKNIKDIINSSRSRTVIPRPDNKIEQAFKQMRTELNSLATNAFASSAGYGKYFTINPKDKYIEFRSAGGVDYVNNISKLQNTMLRYARAMSIGMDVNAEKQEYAKKLYKLLGDVKLEKNSDGKVTTVSKQDPIWYFSQYVANELPRAALKSFIKQIQSTRKLYKRSDQGEKMFYRVAYKAYEGGDRQGGPQTTVQASSQDEAIALARAEWHISSETHRGWQNSDFIARPIGSTSTGAANVTTQNNPDNLPRWEVFNINDYSWTVPGFGDTERDAIMNALQTYHYSQWTRGSTERTEFRATLLSDDATSRQYDSSNDIQPGHIPDYLPNNTQEGNWAIRNRDTSLQAGRGPILYQFQALGNNLAIDIAMQYATAMGVSRGLLWLSPTSEVPREYRTQRSENHETRHPVELDVNQTSTTGYWIVFNSADGVTNMDNLALLPAITAQDAQLAYQHWLQNTGYMLGREARFYLRPADSYDIIDARDRNLPVPPRMPANSSQTLEPSNPEGNWGIRASDGRIVYRFISHNTGTLIDRLRAYAAAIGQDYRNYSIDRVDPESTTAEPEQSTSTSTDPNESLQWNIIDSATNEVLHHITLPSTTPPSARHTEAWQMGVEWTDDARIRGLSIPRIELVPLPMLYP